MVHHGKEMCDVALQNGDEDKIDCWFEDSVIRFDVGRDLEVDEHHVMMLTTHQSMNNGWLISLLSH